MISWFWGAGTQVIRLRPRVLQRAVVSDGNGICVAHESWVAGESHILGSVAYVTVAEFL